MDDALMAFASQSPSATIQKNAEPLSRITLRRRVFINNAKKQLASFLKSPETVRSDRWIQVQADGKLAIQPAYRRQLLSTHKVVIPETELQNTFEHLCANARQGYFDQLLSIIEQETNHARQQPTPAGGRSPLDSKRADGT